MEAVWPETFVEEANLNQMIFLLRRALGATQEREYIATVPKRGYRFTDSVRSVDVPCRFESIAVLLWPTLAETPQEYLRMEYGGSHHRTGKIASLRVVSRTQRCGSKVQVRQWLKLRVRCACKLCARIGDEIG